MDDQQDSSIVQMDTAACIILAGEHAEEQLACTTAMESAFRMVLSR